MQPEYTFIPIGIIRSCFTEKFGIPRQPRLAAAARGTLEILPPFDRDETVRGLEAFSHLWIIFVFHGIPQGKWRSTVRPPRLGGNRRVGVWATRSGFRPNAIGMSAVVLEQIHRYRGKLVLELSGIDILDETPVLDIKPYLPDADTIVDAVGGFADQRPDPKIPVVFAAQALHVRPQVEKRHPGFSDLLEQVLRADPRPAYADRRRSGAVFGLRLYDVNIRFAYEPRKIIVNTIDMPPAESTNS
jgi:tRNA-Thr(GGU) m(6)t(6)A37 methyltransferase TsaA